MASPKLIVAYPQPKDAEAFDAVYEKEHVPLAVAKLAGKRSSQPRCCSPLRARRHSIASPRFIFLRWKRFRDARNLPAVRKPWPTQ